MMEFKPLIEIYLAGILVLIWAVLINLIAKFLKIPGWYDFLNNIKEKGFSSTLAVQDFFSIAFLFLIYPFLLGTIAFLIFKYLF